MRWEKTKLRTVQRQKRNPSAPKLAGNDTMSGQKKKKKTGNGNGSCGEASLPLSPARALPNELLMVQLLPSQAHHNKVETGAVKVCVLQHSFCSLPARYKRWAGSACKARVASIGTVREHRLQKQAWVLYSVRSSQAAFRAQRACQTQKFQGLPLALGGDAKLARDTGSRRLCAATGCSVYGVRSTCR